MFVRACEREREIGTTNWTSESIDKEEEKNRNRESTDGRYIKKESEDSKE